ncbi:copper chaperone PCu(A)C [Devosia sp. D6-9]|nr:copper chaperone PCu(A)C [Devosia sp. D6-9]
MHKLSFGALAGAALVLSTVGSAFAHAGISPATAANNATVKAVVTIPHGCDGAATDTVSIKLPEGFVNAKPMAKAGWQIAITKGDYSKAYDNHGTPVTSGALEITWSGGSLPDDQFDEFTIQGQFQGFDAESPALFITTQKCGATEVTWNEIAGPGQNPHTLERPAPTITVTPAAAGGEHDHMNMGGMDMSSPVTVGNLELTESFARATLPNQPVGGGYVTITNKGSEADRLVSASSPAAGSVQVHEMKMEGDVMKMRELPDGVEIPAGQSVALSPGGLHLMFMKLNGAFKEGDEVPVTLTFEKAGPVEIKLPVMAASADAPAHDHMKM